MLFNFPRSKNIEKIILGIILINNNLFNKINISENDFFYKKNQIIFNSIKNILTRKKYIDPILLYNSIKSKQIYIKLNYILDLVQFAPISFDIKKYIKILKEKSHLRNILNILIKGIKKINLNIKSKMVINYINTKFSKLDSNYKETFFSIYSILKNVMKNILSKRSNFLKSGFKKLDNLINGFKYGELIIIAGRPSTGKTAFCINLCKNLSLINRVPILLFSLEMSKEQILIRLISCMSKVCSSNIFLNKISKKDFSKINNIKKILKYMKIFINDITNFNILDIKIEIYKIFKKYGFVVVIIDYIQLIKYKNFINKYNELSEISRILKSISKELNIPIICLSQLNRNIDQRIDKKPILSDLRDSGSIEQDADMVFFLTVKKEKLNYKEINMYVTKNRNGPTGKIEFIFFNNYMIFKDK
ncbi:replicative DNA helicase [Candidatus Vidania fulgoroideorum]